MVGPPAGAQSDGRGLRAPRTLAADAAGHLLVTDTENHRIVRIDPGGTMTVVAGTGKPGFSGDGGPATAARLNRPRNLTVAPDGALIVADTDNRRIRRVDAAGVITTIAGSGASRASGDGGPALAAGFADPRDVAFDAAGNLFVADTIAHRIRRIDPHGTVTTVAGTGRAGFGGDGGPATAGLLNEPRGVAVDPAGDLFIADSSNNRVRWVDGAGTIRTLFGTGQRKDAPGAMGLADPRGLNTDRAGRVFVADTGNDRVLQVR